MDEATIQKQLERAAENLFTNQPNIFDFTSVTGETEWNLAHHLANEIAKLFPDLACDLDVTKRPHNFKRPDIILHQRGCHERNFLVVEIKRNGSPNEIREDEEKIKSCWFQNPLWYQFGAVINLRKAKNYSVRTFRNSIHNFVNSRP